MGPKRKKPSIPEGPDRVEEKPAPAKTPRLAEPSGLSDSDSPKRRRSQRLRVSDSITSSPAAPSGPDAGEAGRRTRKRERTVAEEVLRLSMEQSGPWKSKEVVDEAKRDLVELERTLKSQTRKRQKDVEDSYLRLKTDDAGLEVDREVTLTGKDLVAKAERDKQIVADGLGTKKVQPAEKPIKTWVGRVGYACLNTYLRTANPPIFSSRTCRLSTIEYRSHPLTDPTQPFHATKNPPNPEKPKDPSLGLQYVQSLGLANARDIIPMLRWNARYGIFFMRLSSEMFPFASHSVQGYDLEFAADVLSEAGSVAASLNHRVTTHPGQYTQLGSPRSEVVEAAVRDLDYHDQMLELLKLPDQLDRDAVMIIHMGGTFGDKEATLERFEENYSRLKPSVQRRLVLENDDVCWSVHDILPTCEKLNIPLVLDWHHHTVIYDEAAGMTGSHEELLPLLPRIAETWKRKGITQKMHYSEPAMLVRDDGSPATPRDRRKHSARVQGLPPWRAEGNASVDMMIEAKDKEQAVFELMMRFEGEGWAWEGIGDVLPHVRGDQSGRDKGEEGADGQLIDALGKEIDNGLDVGGVGRRVYWPRGRDEWLRPKKRTRKAREEDDKGLSNESG